MPPRAAITAASSSRSTMWCGEPVEETHDVGLLELGGQRVEAHRLAAEALREPDRAVVVAVRDEHRAARRARSARAPSARRSRRRRSRSRAGR